MKRRFLIVLLVGMTIFLTSCQHIEKAVEDTFSTQPQKANAGKENNDKGFLENLKNIFIDKSNERVFVTDIIKDAEEKIGYEFPTSLYSHFSRYISENDIHRYLSKEEVIEIAKEYDRNNFLLNTKKRDEVMEELFELVDTRDFYIYQTRFRILDNSIYIYIVNPNNPEQVDLYYYNLSVGKWIIQPEKLSANTDPMKDSILFSNINFDAFEKIIETGKEVLKEIGDYREYNIMNKDLGINTISAHLDGEDLIFKAKVEGVREDYNLTFDRNGNLIEKERD
ncbi:hypothetical protein [Helcococcus sueciensis]|uniref:hypothetical protein n=1 Tax=Helcococcus sueciensis TaxID=241555 RepID=UPI00041E74BC|nr:hypothetical protein [Helcococcus sueciensis]